MTSEPISPLIWDEIELGPTLKSWVANDSILVRDLELWNAVRVEFGQPPINFMGTPYVIRTYYFDYGYTEEKVVRRGELAKFLERKPRNSEVCGIRYRPCVFDTTPGERLFVHVAAAKQSLSPRLYPCYYCKETDGTTTASRIPGVCKECFFKKGPIPSKMLEQGEATALFKKREEDMAKALDWCVQHTPVRYPEPGFNYVYRFIRDNDNPKWPSIKQFPLRFHTPRRFACDSFEPPSAWGDTPSPSSEASGGPTPIARLSSAPLDSSLTSPPGAGAAGTMRGTDGRDCDTRLCVCSGTTGVDAYGDVPMSKDALAVRPQHVDRHAR